MRIDFEEAFGNFIDRREYDSVESALFTALRAAFIAGWKAAGGELPVSHKIIELHSRCILPPTNKVSDQNQFDLQE